MFGNKESVSNSLISQWQFIPYFSVQSGILVQLLSAS